MLQIKFIKAAAGLMRAAVDEARVGGVIVITPDGQMAWSFNTPGMYRAKLAEGGRLQIGIYGDEP